MARWARSSSRTASGEAEYRGERFRDSPRDLKGNNDLLSITRPELIAEIHRRYLDAGADIIETNTFNASAPSQADYGLEALVRELNLAVGADRAAGGGRGGGPDRPHALRGRRARAHEPHGVALAEGQRSGLPQHELRRTGRDLCRGHARAGRRRRRHDPGRDDLRHAEREGGALRGAAGARRAASVDLPILSPARSPMPPAARSPGRPSRPSGTPIRHARPLVVGLNCALGAKQLRPYVEELARIADTYVCAYPNAGLPNAFGEYDEAACETAALLRDFADERLRQHRRRLLRDDARAHRAHPRGRRRAAAAQARRRSSRARRLAGLEPLNIGPGQPVRQRRRAHQRHRLGEVPPPDRSGRLRRRARGRATAGRERRADDRRQHGRGHARFRRRDGSVPESARRRTRRCARARDDRFVEVVGDRVGPQVPAGQGRRQFDQPQGGRGALPRAGPARARVRRRRRGDGVRRVGPGRHRRAQGLRSASAATACSSTGSASRPRTSSSTRTSSRWRPASSSTTGMRSISSRRRRGSVPPARTCS